jgi:hypothetical protein
MTNNCNVLDNDGSVDDFGDQGSVNYGRLFVNYNWCRIRNWRLNSSPLDFRGKSLNRSGTRSLNLSRILNLN